MRDSIEARRLRIDRIDETIVILLGERAKLAIAIGKLKQEQSLPVRDLNREGEKMRNLLKLASTTAASPELIASLFREIMKDSVKLQQSNNGKIYGKTSRIPR